MSGSGKTRLSFELRWKIEDGTKDAGCRMQMKAMLFVKKISIQFCDSICC